MANTCSHSLFVKNQNFADKFMFFCLLRMLIVALSDILTVLTKKYGDRVMNVFLVTQNKSHEVEFNHEFIWSPKRNKKGGMTAGFETMKDVRRGDIILNTYDQAIKGVSVAKEDVYSSDRPDLPEFDTEDSWNIDGWRVHVSIVPVDFSLRDDREYFSENKGQTFDKRGMLQQRYLSKLTPELIAYFDARIPEFSAQLKADIKVPQGEWDKVRTASFALHEKQDSFSTADLNWDVPVEELMSPDLKAIIGLIGERAAVQYLREKYPDATVIGRSKNLDPQNGSDSLGYDIEMILKNGERYLIDVKSTTGTSDMFFLSANEHHVAEVTKDVMNESYYILRVSGLNKDTLTGNVQFVTLDDVELHVNSYRALIKKH